MKLIKHKSAAIASAIILSYGVVGNLALADKAEDVVRQSDTEYSITCFICVRQYSVGHRIYLRRYA